MSRMDSSGIRKVFDMGTRMKDPIDLSIGQPDFDVFPDIKREAITWIEKGFNKYTVTQGIPELRERIAQKLREDNRVDARIENVVVTSGVIGGIFLSLNVLLDPGDGVILPDPYFVAYKHLPNFISADITYIDTYPDFDIDAKKFKNAIKDNTKVLVITTPCNPTGRVYSRQTLKKIASIAERNEIVVLSDEVYEKFVYDNEHVSIGSMYENTVTLNGFSKCGGMTGWRIGYASGPEQIIREIIKLQQYTYICAPSFAQKAALRALESDSIKKEIEIFRQRRDIGYEMLKRNFKLRKPEGAFYFFPEAPNKSGTEFVKKAIDNSVLIIPGNVFSERDTHFRISYAVREENLKNGIEILNSIAAGR